MTGAGGNESPEFCPGPVRQTRAPDFRPPPGSCDCHAHVLGPARRFAFSAARSYTPEDCTIEQYLALLRTLGFARGVLVQGGAHGVDNTAMLDGLARAPRLLRGVAVIPPGLPRSQLARLHAAGVRGVRMSTVVGGGVGFDQLERLSAQVASLGWHVMLHFGRSEELIAVAPQLERIGTPFVLDHMARIRASEGIRSAPFQTLLRLLDTDRCWIKLASLYRLSSLSYPHLDMLEMVHAVVRERPDRILWGSNWPHPMHHGPMPNDGDLVDLIPSWVPCAAARQRMLVENPATLYGFE